jgi:hypothetical protein
MHKKEKTMKVLTTGNPKYGLAEGIAKTLKSSFASRSNGYDLSSDEGMDKFVHLAINYDIIIINCYTEKMNNYSQVRLLHKLYTQAQEQSLKIHIICIGSISDHINTEQSWLKYISYGAEKLALQRLCETINHNRENISPQIKCTYLSLGHMHTPLVDRYHPAEIKLNTEYVASLIKWIIDSPECIESITITKDKENG